MISVVYTHWAMSPHRSKVMRRSIGDLIHSKPTEILVADNGGSIEDSRFLLDLCERKDISLYLRFRNNMHFSFARNALLPFATQPYICIMDNDIIVEKGWWELCVDFISKHPKTIVTPLVADKAHQGKKFWGEPIDGWQTNQRAGSPCFVMSRETFEDLGLFPLHNMGGSKYADTIVRKGYTIALTPRPYAVDIGERQGYDWRNPDYSQEL